MGDVTNDHEPVDRAREALLGHARRYAELGFAPVVAELAGQEPYRSSVAGTPLILDTDIGGDPDDAIALAVAALHVPELALVLTCDERGGQRARFARHLLDLLGRPEVPVVAGRQLATAEHFCADRLVPGAVPAQPVDTVDAVASVVESAVGSVRWVGIGPMSNLAEVVRQRMDLMDRLRVTQMGGALSYRDPDRGEHNFRVDVAAVGTVIRALNRAWLVTSDVTFTGETAITAGSEIYRWLAGPDAPAWAGKLRAHLDHWFDAHHPGSMQHDALTLSAALELPFVDFSLNRVGLDEIGRMRRDPDGDAVFLSHTVDYQAFRRWLSAQLAGDPRP